MSDPSTDPAACPHVLISHRYKAVYDAAVADARAAVASGDTGRIAAAARAIKDADGGLRACVVTEPHARHVTANGETWYDEPEPETDSVIEWLREQIARYADDDTTYTDYETAGCVLRELLDQRIAETHELTGEETDDD